MNQIFSNIIYNNRNQINRRQQSNIQSNLNMNNIIYNSQNTYNNTTNRINYSLSWRSNSARIDNTTNTINTDTTDNNLNEPIINIPINSVIPQNLNEIENNDDENFLETLIYNNDEFNSIMHLNNLNNGPNDTTYHSLFEYNNYNIRYNHENLISPNDADIVLQNILNSIFEEEFISQSMDNSNINSENSIETQRLIEKNIIEKKYSEIKDIIKNDICPISMESFSNNETICMFVKCNHGIHYDNKLQFIKLFNKCPLCNDMIY